LSLLKIVYDTGKKNNKPSINLFPETDAEKIFASNKKLGKSVESAPFALQTIAIAFHARVCFEKNQDGKIKILKLL